MSEPRHTYSDGRHEWDVKRLWDLADGLPTVDREPDSFHEWLEYGWEEVVTLKDVVEHMRRVQSADLRYPIIVSAEGHIMDGCHRLARAALERTTVRAIQFVVTPEPDGHATQRRDDPMCEYNHLTDEELQQVRSICAHSCHSVECDVRQIADALDTAREEVAELKKERGALAEWLANVNRMSRRQSDQITDLRAKLAAVTKERDAMRERVRELLEELDGFWSGCDGEFGRCVAFKGRDMMARRMARARAILATPAESGEGE